MSDEASAITDRSGRLQSATYHFDEDLPRDILRIDLEFELGQWSVLVDENDDTVQLLETAAIGKGGPRTAHASAFDPWSDAIGCTVRWVWSMENQQGYRDAIQFEFTDVTRSGTAAMVQLVALSSCLKIKRIVPIDTPLLTTP